MLKERELTFNELFLLAMYRTARELNFSEMKQKNLLEFI
jgi:hypothetical protein